MKKALFTQLILLFLSSKTFCQGVPESMNQIQRFVEATVQIPFMARVANVQGVVDVKVTMNSENIPESYEVVKKMRTDCDLEAIRVVRLINLRNLRTELYDKKKIIIQVPFFNNEIVLYENEYVIEYYDKDKKVTLKDPDIKFVRRYLVDTLSGIIKSNAEFFEYNKKKEAVRSGFAFLKVDSSERHQPNFLEIQTDTLKKYYFSAFTNSVFPNIAFNKYANGQILSKNVMNKYYTYFPNGRIESEESTMINGKEKTVLVNKWFANGQLAYQKTVQINDSFQSEKYIAVWDTVGKQIVINGNGMDEYYEGNLKNLVIHSGLLKNGIREGKWIGKDSNNEIEYVESYENGNCIKGISYLGKDSLMYVNPNENAEYKSGLTGFSSHLMYNLKYPSAAQRANVSGTVYVQFVVCTDGTLCNYKVLKGVGFGCDEESVRVLQLSSGKWKPGKIRGRAVRTRFTIPINYQLSR